MPRSECLPAVRIVCAALLSLLLTGSVALPASAQTIRVQNGAVVEVGNGGVWDLQGGMMDFGPATASTRLREEQAGRVTGGRLTATRDFGSPSQASLAGLGVVLSAAADVGEITITRGHIVQTAANGNASIARYYDISVAQNNSGLDATLRLEYADAELNGLVESDLELFKSADGGATWSREGADSRNAQFNLVTLSGVDSFSRWTLGGASSPLPVELASFTGAQTDTGVRLSWQTASETANAGFRVQRRSRAAGTWTKVGFVESRADGGTTTDAQSYRFTDADLPFAADSIAYRLQQVDTDGTTSLSEPVTIARSAVGEAQLLGTYPNPARSRATVRFALPDGAADARLALFDVLGRRVETVARNPEPGRHERTVSVSTLSSGVYFVRLRAAGSVQTQKLTVVR